MIFTDTGHYGLCRASSGLSFVHRAQGPQLAKGLQLAEGLHLAAAALGVAD